MTLLRSALAAVLANEEDLKVVGELRCSGDIGSAAQALRPDVAVIDLDPRGAAALRAAAALNAALPACEVLMLVGQDSAGPIHRALDARARGLLSKDTCPRELAQAIRRVYRGERVIDPALAVTAVSAPPNPLTHRELDVLRLAAGGVTSAEIADQLYLSCGTVRNYLSAILRKIGARNRFEAVRTAERAGWL
jgi:two-component system response regulator DesR